MTPRFYVAKILPVGLFMALTLHFGNLVYLYLTVSALCVPDSEGVRSELLGCTGSRRVYRVNNA